MDTYDVIVIGAGPAGSVYRALDQEIDDDVALKVIRPDVFDTDEDKERFVRILRKARRLSQQIIVRVYDVLSSVSVAHTRINVTLVEAVTADVTQGAIDAGLDAIQSADPSEGLNSILVVFSTLNDANQSAVSADDQTEQTTEAAVALFEEVRARLVRQAGPVRAPSVRGRVATRAAGGRRPGQVCGRRRDHRAADADILGGARHHGDDVWRYGRRDPRGAQ